MRVLQVFDRKDYAPHARRTVRRAARAIIFKAGNVAMVKSEREGFYTFPGGGMENGETLKGALCREVREETGLIVREETIAPFGMIREVHSDLYRHNCIFEHISYYYRCDVQGEIDSQNLDDYESELGFHLAFVPISLAIAENRSRAGGMRSSFLRRELRVLEMLENSECKQA